MKRRLVMMLLVCLPSVGLDQLTKYLATAHLAGKPGMSFLGGIVRLQYALNPGAWGGLGGGLPEPTRKLIFTLAVGLFLAVLAWYILRQAHANLVTLALALVLSGGIGNLIDRALYGHVVDFMYIGLEGLTGIGWLHTNIFNVADVAIMAGAGLLLLHTLFHRETEPKQPEPEAAEAEAPHEEAPRKETV